MARIAGVNIPNNAHIVIGLQAIYGIGSTRAKLICAATGIEGSTKVKDLDENQLEALREQVLQYEVEGDLRREITMIWGVIEVSAIVVVFLVVGSVLKQMLVHVKVQEKLLQVKNKF